MDIRGNNTEKVWTDYGGATEGIAYCWVTKWVFLRVRFEFPNCSNKNLTDLCVLNLLPVSSQETVLDDSNNLREWRVGASCHTRIWNRRQKRPKTLQWLHNYCTKRHRGAPGEGVRTVATCFRLWCLLVSCIFPSSFRTRKTFISNCRALSSSVRTGLRDYHFKHFRF